MDIFLQPDSVTMNVTEEAQIFRSSSEEECEKRSQRKRIKTLLERKERLGWRRRNCAWY
jgi:hypothetical protein